MTTGHVIEFKPNGEAIAMHNDSFPLGILGHQEIERASEIIFEELDQSWSICLRASNGWISNSRYMQQFSTYELARQVEVKWLNSCRLAGCTPTSDQGMKVLKEIRKTA